MLIVLGQQNREADNKFICYIFATLNKFEFHYLCRIVCESLVMTKHFEWEKLLKKTGNTEITNT